MKEVDLNGDGSLEQSWTQKNMGKTYPTRNINNLNLSKYIYIYTIVLNQSILNNSDLFGHIGTYPQTPPREDRL